MKGDVACEVDGEPIPAEMIGVLQQQVPYPGGHRYRIVFRGAQPRRVFREFANGQIDSLVGDKTASSLLFFAAAVLMNLKTSEGAEKIVLNSVESAVFDDGHVELVGVCSEIVLKRR